jgi:hypothetical protein
MMRVKFERGFCFFCWGFSGANQKKTKTLKKKWGEVGGLL